ncbi:MAG: AraC family transcriptional regulator [Monoglobales bacterium]
MFAFPVYNKELPIYIAGLGLNYDQKGTYRKNGYQDYQWIQTKSGSGILEIENTKYIISEGEGFLLPPNVEHGYYPSEGTWIQDWVSFNGNSVDVFLKELNLPPFSINLLKNNTISLLISRAFDAYDNPLCNVLNSSIIIEILHEISIQRLDAHSNLSLVLNYINENYCKDLTLNDMAALLKMSPQHFCKVFYKNMKLRPFQYISKIRTSKSKEIMLSNPLMPLEEVAIRVGFSCSSYYCKVFKANEGITPTEFKNLYYNYNN